MGIVKNFRVGETGLGEMGRGEMGQIIGETGVREMGVGEMGVILCVTDGSIGVVGQVFISLFIYLLIHLLQEKKKQNK